MGFFSKLFGTAAVTGAAIGGALYVKNRKETRKEDEVFEDLSDEKYVDYKFSDDKIDITFNTKKAKQTADQVADIIIDTYDDTVDKVADKIGEEKVEQFKEKKDFAKEKAKDASAFVKEKAGDTKDVIVDTIGEERIDETKDKIKDVANDAKEIIDEKVVTPIKEKVTFMNDADQETKDDFEGFDDDAEADTEADVDADKDVAIEDAPKEEPKANTIDSSKFTTPEFNNEEKVDFLDEELDDL